MIHYVIRHGETDWNRAARLQGQKDIPINETGRRQARGNGARLARLLGSGVSGFDFVASPLGRTRETMERLRAEMGLDPLGYRVDGRLVELSFGDWEGLTFQEMGERDRRRMEAREAAKWDFIPPGADAESYEILSWRVGAWLGGLDRPTVCVTHGGVMRCLFYLVAGLTGEEASVLDIPQDRILRIDGARMDWL